MLTILSYVVDVQEETKRCSKCRNAMQRATARTEQADCLGGSGI